MEKNTLRWPDEKKIAVLVTVMFETWSECKGPGYTPMATPLREGTEDRLGISWGQYGGRTGIWRIMRLLDDFAIRATVCLSGRSAEVFPDAAKELHNRGHELAGHSYTQDTMLPYLSSEEEREVIGKCRRIIEEIAGTRPVGWLSPRCTPTGRTARLLAEEGFLWHGDYNDTDLPYAIETGKGPLVAIPHSDFTDNRVLRGSPRDFYRVYRDTFQYLYGNEPPAMINMTIHAHFGGRPLIASIVSEVLKFMKRFPGVWFARHDEVARWLLEIK